MLRQIGFFDGSLPLKLRKPIRLIELFAGIGSQAKALERLGVKFEHYRVCEFDQYAITSYNAIHGTDFEVGDVKTWSGSDLGIVDTNEYDYILTYSFPCQDLSIAGRQGGMSEGSETRSALLWEVKRLLQETALLPQVLIMENVPEVVGNNNRENFNKWVNFLESLGYKSKWQILNSRDYEVPQNRERCFMVSWLGDYYYDFPAPKPLTKVLRDLLQPESEIEERYYLSEKGVNYVLRQDIKRTQSKTQHIKCEQVATLEGGKWDKMHESSRRIYSADGLSPTVTTVVSGNSEPKVMIEPVLVGGYGEKKSNNGTQWYQQDRIYSADSVGMAHCASLPGGSYSYYVGENVNNADGIARTVRASGRGSTDRHSWDLVADFSVWDMYNAKEIDSDCCGTITSAVSHQGSGTFCVKNGKSPIRKLTPKECWRLMDFDDEDYDKSRISLNEKFYNGKDRSGSQLYKQAGNSIVVNCLVAIMGEMIAYE